MGEYFTSLLRTAVPALWGSVVAWAVGANLIPAELIEQAEGFAVVLVAVVIAAYYAAVRGLEPHLPGWLSRLLIGSSKPPAYEPAGAGRHALADDPTARGSAPQTYPAD